MNIFDKDKKFLILDGAMGTTLQKYNLDSRYFLGSKSFEVLNFTKEDLIKEVHRKYIECGADIIGTNTFNCNRIALKGTSMEKRVYEICKKGVELARKVREEMKSNVLIAGSVGSLSISLTFDKEKESEVREAYLEQISGIVDGGVDFLLLETVYDFKNLQVALEVIDSILKKREISLPVVISFTCDNDGKIYSGESIKKIIEKIDEKNIVGYGLNCVGNNPFIKKLREITDKKIFFYPNSNILEEVENVDNYFKELIDKNFVNIVGGCCGTDFSFITRLNTLKLS